MYSGENTRYFRHSTNEQKNPIQLYGVSHLRVELYIYTKVPPRLILIHVKQKNTKEEDNNSKNHHHDQ